MAKRDRELAHIRVTERLVEQALSGLCVVSRLAEIDQADARTSTSYKLVLILQGPMSAVTPIADNRGHGRIVR